MQLLVTNAKNCDFFIWSHNDYHLERIFADKETCDIISSKSEELFFNAILPELMARAITKIHNNTATN